MTSELSVRCGAKTKAGTPCKQWAIQGGTRCRKHGAGAPQVKAKAAVVAELRSWRLGDATEDPGEVLLRLVTQSAHRAQMYAEELESLVDKEGFIEAMAGDVMIPTKYGQYKAGEYPRVLATWEAQERDRLANFAAKAVAAGLAERQVRLAEKQGQMMAAIVMKALSDPELPTLPPGAADAIKAAIGRQVRELTP